MNKLISRNPVLRFKNGLKIIKAANGFNMSRLIRHGSGNSSSYTDANGNIVFLNGKMSDEAVKYMKSKGYSDSYINRTLENMKVGNVWDRSLKTNKNPYGRWRIDNGRSDSEWNDEILAEALKNRLDVRREKNGQYSFRTDSGKWKYLNEPVNLKSLLNTSSKSSKTETSKQSNIYFKDDKGHIVGRRLKNGRWTYRAPVDYEWYSGLPGKNDDILQFTSDKPLTIELYNQIRKLWNHYNSGFLDAFFRSSEKAAQNMNDWAVRAYGRTNNPDEYMNNLGLIFSTRESPYTKMKKVYQDIEKGLSLKLNDFGYTTYIPASSEEAGGGYYKQGGSILKLKGGNVVNGYAVPRLVTDISATLKMLKEAGYDLGNYGENKDGIDGIWGNKTQAAWNDYLAKNIKVNPNKTFKVAYNKDTQTATNMGFVPTLQATQKSTLQTTTEPSFYGEGITDFNRGSIRGFRNQEGGFRNVDEYYNWLNNNQNSDLYKLWNNVLEGMDEETRRSTFNQIMNLFGISGNLGRRDSERLANVLNTLRDLGVKGSANLTAFMNSYRTTLNNELAEGRRNASPITSYTEQFRNLILNSKPSLATPTYVPNYNMNYNENNPSTYRYATSIYKQGGLIPKNPVKLFKTNFRKGAL